MDTFRENILINTTKTSVLSNTVAAIIKIYVGIISFSFFFCISALYSLIIAYAKYNALAGISTKDEKEQNKHYFSIGLTILTSGIIYIIYSTRMFTGVTIFPQLSIEIAITIAAYTFLGLILNIRSYIISRKIKNLISQAIRLTNLSSSFICLVLTQISIMSVAYQGDASLANGLSGIVFGSLVILIGIFMITKSTLIYRKTQLSTNLA